MGRQEIHPESSKEEWTTQSSAEAFWEGGLDIEPQERIKKSECPANAENLTKYNHYCPVREFCLLYLPGNDRSERLPSDRIVALRLAPRSEDIAPN